jgi:hypothetical protein
LRYLVAVLAGGLFAAPPTVDDLLKLKGIGGAIISLDGRYVAYSVTGLSRRRAAGLGS